jgi:hypothetical protein
MSDRGIRFCVPVCDAPDPPQPSAVKDSCAWCQQPVWIDSAQELPAEAREAGVDSVCRDCALADPVVGPAVIRSLPRVYRAWLETGVVPGIEIDDGQ